MKLASEIERAWAAGFFDGEGTSGCYLSKAGQRHLAVSVVQVERQPLERFHRAVSGVGSINGPRRTGSPVLKWNAYGRKGLIALAILSPYLSEPKLEQALRAKIAFSLRRVIDPERCRRGHLYAEVGEYVTPSDGSRQCVLCRSLMRAGRGDELPAKRFPTALELRWGVREHRPDLTEDLKRSLTWPPKMNYASASEQPKQPATTTPGDSQP